MIDNKSKINCFLGEFIMHILIIEDEKQLCQSIAEGLRMDGYEADTCLTGMKDWNYVWWKI